MKVTNNFLVFAKSNRAILGCHHTSCIRRELTSSCGHTAAALSVFQRNQQTYHKKKDLPGNDITPYTMELAAKTKTTNPNS